MNFLTNLTVPMERLSGETLHDSRFDSLVAEHFNRYKFCEPFIVGKSVLDAACGNGFGARLMAEAGAKQIDAIDISPEAIAMAQQHYPHLNVRFEVGDLLSLTVTNHYDVAVSFETIEHIVETERYLQVMHNALKPGGLFFVSTPNRKVANPGATRFDKPKNPFHRFELTRDELVQLLGNYFLLDEIYGQHPYYYKGTRIRTLESIATSGRLRKLLHLPKADYVKLSQVRQIKSWHEPAFLIARCLKRH